MNAPLKCFILPSDVSVYEINQNNREFKFEVVNNNPFDVKVSIQVNKRNVLIFDRNEFTLKEGIASKVTVKPVQTKDGDVTMKIVFQGNGQTYAIKRKVQCQFAIPSQNEQPIAGVDPSADVSEMTTIRSVLLLPLIIACFVLKLLEWMEQVPILGYIYNPFIIFVLGWITVYAQYQLHVRNKKV